MEWLNELLKMALSAGAGGGMLWLFNFRKRVRRQENEMVGEDFNLLSNTVNKAMQDMATLSDRIGQLEMERLEILEQIKVLRHENEALKKENKHLEEVLRDYIRKNNPNLRIS